VSLDLRYGYVDGEDFLVFALPAKQLLADAEHCRVALLEALDETRHLLLDGLKKPLLMLAWDE
jgi:hypothetical protein